MATETLRPDGQLSCLELVTCDYLEHDEDPDVSSVTINATGNAVSTEYGVDFPSPTGDPRVGAGLQEFRAGVIEFDSGQSGTPNARIELWENGSLVRAGSNTPISTYQVLSFTWNANELATADGSLVQCKVIGVRATGGPSARNTVRIGHIEWNVDYTVGGGISVTPAVASAGSSAIDPGVVLGSLGLSPVLASAVAQAIDPIIKLGSLLLGGYQASAVAAASDPTVMIQDPPVTPGVASAGSSALDPGVVLGSLSLGGYIAAVIATAINPTVLIAGGAVGGRVFSKIINGLGLINR